MKFLKLSHISPDTGAPSGKVYWVKIDSIVSISNSKKISMNNGESFFFAEDLHQVLMTLDAEDCQKVKTPERKIKVDKYHPSVQRIVTHYKNTHPTRGKHLKRGSRDWKRIESRLEDGIPEEDLIKAIDGNMACSWHKAHPGGHSIEYIFRNATKVEGFVQIATGALEKEQEVGHHRGSSEFTDGDRSDVF
jgi:hypothetical protein